jgi:hypothetical protein
LTCDCHGVIFVEKTRKVLQYRALFGLSDLPRGLYDRLAECSSIRRVSYKQRRQGSDVASEQSPFLQP